MYFTLFLFLLWFFLDFFDPDVDPETVSTDNITETGRSLSLFELVFPSTQYSGNPKMKVLRFFVSKSYTVGTVNYLDI